MKPNVVICPGLPRSGTTYTYNCLTTPENVRFFNTPERKESNFFLEDSPVTEFIGSFTSRDEDKYFLDYSPAYLIAINRAIDRIIAAKAQFDIKLIIHLRHPLDQMYSHYLHDLTVHISRREWGNDLNYSFFSERSLRKYAALRSQSIAKIVDNFDRDDILAINFNTHIQDPAILTRKISQFLDLELSLFPKPAARPGGWVPYFVYGNGDQELLVGEHVLRVPDQTLVLVNGYLSEVWHNVPQDLAVQLIQDSNSWTRLLTKPQCAEIFEEFQADWSESLNLLGLSESDFTSPNALVAKPAPANSRVLLDSLEPVAGGLRGRVSQCLYSTV